MRCRRKLQNVAAQSGRRAGNEENTGTLAKTAAKSDFYSIHLFGRNKLCQVIPAGVRTGSSFSEQRSRIKKAAGLK
jgi:hypothetical protein